VSDHFDLLVIGSGPAGEKGAAQAAYFGKRVCLVERAPKPGGAAVNTGAIPAKALRETALYFSGLRARGVYGVDYRVQPDRSLSDFMYRERVVVESEWQRIEENLARHGVGSIQGTATLLDGHTVEVHRGKEPPRRLTAEVILLATGAHPFRPDGIPFDGLTVVDSEAILTLPAIPARLVVVGGGAIGSEFASTFAALGTRVTLVNPRDRLLTSLDADASEALREALTRRFGVQVLQNAEVAAITVEAPAGAPLATVQLTDGTALTADCVLVATGRIGASAGLGLEQAGVRTDARGFVLVDDRFRTTVPSVIAAGDLVGFPALASTAMEQARVAVCHAFDLRYKEHLSAALPYSVWTIPEVASVGETEETARDRGLAYEVGRAALRQNPRGTIIGDTDGFVKLVFQREDQRLLGATVVGEGACELIQIAAAVLSFEGTLDHFIQSVYGYPTVSDAYKYAAYDGLQRLTKRLSAAQGLPRVT
jgi:NAD(P) transhydrogenase